MLGIFATILGTNTDTSGRTLAKRPRGYVDKVTHRYPSTRLVGDYVRAGAGLMLTVVPVLLVSLTLVPLIILLLLAALFFGYGLHTILCHRRRISVDDDRISAQPGAIRLNWQELTELKLEYYSTRKESTSGWMQMTLRSDNKWLKLDSRLEGFQDIARLAATSAHANDLFLSRTTAGNLAALGIEVDGTIKQLPVHSNG